MLLHWQLFLCSRTMAKKSVIITQKGRDKLICPWWKIHITKRQGKALRSLLRLTRREAQIGQMPFEAWPGWWQNCHDNKSSIIMCQAMHQVAGRTGTSSRRHGHFDIAHDDGPNALQRNWREMSTRRRGGTAAPWCPNTSEDCRSLFLATYFIYRNYRLQLTLWPGNQFLVQLQLLWIVLTHFFSPPRSGDILLPTSAKDWRRGVILSKRDRSGSKVSN